MGVGELTLIYGTETVIVSDLIPYDILCTLIPLPTTVWGKTWLRLQRRMPEIDMDPQVHDYPVIVSRGTELRYPEGLRFRVQEVALMIKLSNIRCPRGPCPGWVRLASLGERKALFFVENYPLDPSGYGNSAAPYIHGLAVWEGDENLSP